MREAITALALMAAIMWVPQAAALGNTYNNPSSQAAAGAVAGAAAISGAASLAGANSGGNSLTTNEARQNFGDTYQEYTPSAYAPSVQPTVTCLVPINGGLGVPGGSLSFGSGVLDKGCQDREMIRMGLTGDAASQDMANMLIQRELGKLLDTELEAEQQTSSTGMFSAESNTAATGYEFPDGS